MYQSFEKYFPRLSSYVNEEIIQLDENCIEIGIIFHVNGNLIHKKRQMILQIKASRLFFEEGQRDAFINLVGEKYLYLFDEYWNERLQGFSNYFWYEEAIEWLQK